MKIVISCKYQVFDDEWQEILDMLEGLFSRGKYSNLDVELVTPPTHEGPNKLGDNND